MPDPFIKIENLNYSYHRGEDGAPTVLRDINLEIMPGEYVAVLGHNGSGKSTLAKLLNMILTPASGRIWVAGR